MGSAPEGTNKFIRTYSKQMPSVKNKTINHDDIICLDDDEIIVLDEKESQIGTSIRSSPALDNKMSSDSIGSRKCGCLSSRNTSNLNVSSNSSLCALHESSLHRANHKIDHPSNLLKSVLSDIEKTLPSMTSLERVIKWQQINTKFNSLSSKLSSSQMPSTSRAADLDYNAQKRKLPFENPGPNNKQSKIIAEKPLILLKQDTHQSSNEPNDDSDVIEIVEPTISSKEGESTSSNLKLHWSGSSENSNHFFSKRLKPREIDKIKENDSATYLKSDLSSILVRCNYTKNKEDENCFKKPFTPSKKVKLKVKFPPNEESQKVGGSRCSGLISVNENDDNKDVSPNEGEYIAVQDDCSNSTEANVSESSSGQEEHIFEKFSYLDSSYVTLLNSSPKTTEKFIYLEQRAEPKSVPIKIIRKPMKKKKHPLKKRVYSMRYNYTTLRNGKVRSHLKGGAQKLQKLRLKLKPSFRGREVRSLKELPKEVQPSKILLKRISTDSALGQSVFNSPSSQNSEANPITPVTYLKEEDGTVLSAYFESKFNILIVVQEKLVSFWKYRTLLNFLGTGQIWDAVGVIERDTNNYEIISQHQNRFILCEDKICYLEVRGQNLESLDSRECSMTSLYINVYFNSVTTRTIQMRSIQLDTLNVRPKDICFIKNLNYIFIAWTETLPNFTVKSGICKYGLTPSLETLASIREFPHINHKINDLQQINPNKIIAIGDTEISVWNYNTGDLLISTDLKITLGWNIKCFQHVDNNENYIILIQLINSSYLKFIGIKLNDLYSWKILQSFHLPFEFNEKPNTTALLSSLIVAKFNNNITILIPLNNLSNIFINNFYQDDSDNHNKSIFLHDDYIIKVNNSMLIKSVTEYLLEVKLV